MRRVSFWRLLILCLIVLLLANVFSLAAYTYVGKNTYISIEMDNLVPEADLTAQIYEYYLNKKIDKSVFEKLIEKQTVSKGTAIVIVDSVGRSIIGRNLGDRIEASEFGVYFEADIQAVLKGESVRSSDIVLSNKEPAISVGVPIKDTKGSVIGGIFIIKQTSGIQTAFRKLSDTLMIIILVVLPIFIIVLAIGSKRITNPVSQMSDVALEMSKGNFDVRADDSTSGEIGVLARALNTLCDNLSQTIIQLQNEKRQLNQILTSFSDGVAAIDNSGNLTHFNPALMKMFGAVDVVEPIDLVPDKTVWDEFKKVIDTQEQRTIKYKMPNDRLLWISIVPVLTENNVCTGAVGLFKDVTEFERLEQTRRDYVANVSHELRSPLTAVRGLLEPLSDGLVKDEETRQRYYNIMLHEVQRLSRLITDMLQLSRLQSGKESMKIEAVDMQELLEEIHENYKQQAEQKGIHLILDAKNTPYGMTDRDRIEQVLVILIDNAMRYTPDGGSITISAESGDLIIISVTDTGCGIEEKELPHLFERFYKVDKSRNEGGTGLGLSIAKQIMDQLDEEIFVESKVGVGTSFHFTVKRYHSNAIALGPMEERKAYSSDDIIFAEEEENKPETAAESSITSEKKTRIRNPFRKKTNKKN